MATHTRTADPVLIARSRLANAVKSGEDTTEIRRQLEAAKIERCIKNALDTTGLDDRQRVELSVLLASH